MPEVLGRSPVLAVAYLLLSLGLDIRLPLFPRFFLSAFQE
jgi:hypothetical protein